MVFHTVCLLIKELLSWAEKHNRGPMIVESYHVPYHPEEALLIER